MGYTLGMIWRAWLQCSPGPIVAFCRWCRSSGNSIWLLFVRSIRDRIPQWQLHVYRESNCPARPYCSAYSAFYPPGTVKRVSALRLSNSNSEVENVAVANALQLEAARRHATPVLSALITTPCQVWSRWTYPLPYYSVFAADLVLCAVTLFFDSEHLQCIAYLRTLTTGQLLSAPQFLSFLLAIILLSACTR